VRASFNSFGSAESFHRTIGEFSFINKKGDCDIFPPMSVTDKR